MTVPAQTEQSRSDTGASSGTRGRGRSPLRKLSDEEELELTRLYSQTQTSVPEIARRFQVGESSVYRIAQRHGASLRTKSGGDGRAASKPAATRTTRQPRATAKASATPRRGRQSAARSTSATSTSTRRRGASTGGRQATGASRTGRRGSTQAASRTDRGGPGRYRVVFRAEMVFAAATMREALAQAEARGATEITSVSRAD